MAGRPAKVRGAAVSILVVNAGSSSLKIGLFNAEARETLATGTIDWTGPSTSPTLAIRLANGDERQQPVNGGDRHSAAVSAIRTLSQRKWAAADITVVGHRVVHGGTVFRDSVRINADVKTAIARLTELAPLHNPAALQAIAAAEEALPGVPQVAVFDTAFFAELPPAAHVYPVPYEWYVDWGIRRFGFHGTSHAYCADRAAEILGRPPYELRLVICHLGNGCSATAVRRGTALATTMGFTPLEGLMMGTRSGSVDPGLLLYVQQQRGLARSSSTKR